LFTRFFHIELATGEIHVQYLSIITKRHKFSFSFFCSKKTTISRV
jgi:hypothetical protein